MGFEGDMRRTARSLEERLLDPAHQERMRVEESRRVAADQRKLAESRAKAIAATNIPVMFLEKIGGELVTTQAMKETAEIGTGEVVLSGPQGCGKSIAACARLRELLMRDTAFRSTGMFELLIVQPLFVTAAHLSRWDRYNEAKMDALLKASLLVVDDLGAEYADQRGNFLAILDELIADRAANRRPTILTTNLDAAAFKARYGERIADRIREVGRFVSLGGGSMRTRSTEAKP